MIGGPGRSGTTLLVQYFTALGFDTGYDLDEAMTRPDPVSHGGLEHSVGRFLDQGREMPYVAKSPFFGRKLDKHIAEGVLRLRWCIMPMRDLSDAARSRLLASQRAESSGGDFDSQPGGMQAGLRDPRRQERRSAVRFYQLMHVLARHGVSTLPLPFPEFASDPKVLYDRLAPLLEAHSVSRGESAEALEKVVDLALVHKFN